MRENHSFDSPGRGDRERGKNNVLTSASLRLSLYCVNFGRRFRTRIAEDRCRKDGCNALFHQVRINMRETV